MESEQQSGLFKDEVLNPELLDKHADVLQSEHAWPQTLAELVDVISSRLENHHSYETEQSRAIARDLVMLLGKHLGGRMVYLPKGDKLERAIRDAKIYHEFNGKNHDDLSRRYSLSVVMIYDIINRQRKLYMDKIQPGLF